MIEKELLIKSVKLGAAIVGLGVNLVTAWVEEKQMDEKIEKRVMEVIAEMNGK